ncbi:MAG: DUF1801 domain-containing protein [Pseudomonadales bacterium]|nr:DUF1801 domain-containing protein [Pseudomonadales bacterium]
MSERKTTQNKASVTEFIANVKNDRRRADARVVAKMMRKASGKQARMWGPSIVGYGVSRYTLANGKEEEICRIGFSPRAQALTFYLGSFKDRPALLKKLGKHKVSGGGCLYINKLDDVDLDVLQTLMDKAYTESSSSC